MLQFSETMPKDCNKSDPNNGKCDNLI